MQRTVLLCAFVAWLFSSGGWSLDRPYFAKDTFTTLAACKEAIRGVSGDWRCLPHTINPNQR